MYTFLFGLVFLLLPVFASAHGVGQVYALPIPLKYYLATAGLAVALSFFLFAIFLSTDNKQTATQKIFSLKWLAPVLTFLRILTLFVVLLAISAGILGNQNANQNFAPIFFWIFFLIGFGLFSLIFANFWDKVNPWKTLSNWLLPERTKPSLKKISPWFGVVFLIGIYWLELCSGSSYVPQVIGMTLLGYTVLSLILGRVYGNWFEDGEVFSVLFGFIGRLAFFKFGEDNKSIVYLPLSLRLKDATHSWATLAIASVLLAGTSFDSLKETVIWFKWLNFLGFNGTNLVLPNTIGLIISPLPFLAAYLFVIWLMKNLIVAQDFRHLAKVFVWSLIPIAFGYTLAHNFSLVIVTARQMLGLILDPFGLGWNLFHTASYTTSSLLLGAKTIWFVEIGFVVFAHIIGTLYAHILAANNFSNSRIVLKSQFPMLLLMVCFTVLTLWLLSQPLVIAK